MDYRESVRLLEDEFGQNHIDLTLVRIKRLLSELGDPHHSLRFIHVAGTNGKGSVSSMLASILNHSGHRAGLYTSPHLEDVTERINVAGTRISKRSFSAMLERLLPLLRKHRTTYFETLTVMAILHFKEQQVDFAVMEVGLGGRLDATNVCDGMMGIITNISLDHTEWLGKRLEKIATEKAGIIKAGQTVITGTRGRLREIISKMAMEKGAELISIPSVKRGMGLTIGAHRGLKLCLSGRFQEENARLVIACVDQLIAKGYRIPEQDIRTGLLRTGWPGRLETYRGTILDCAHNLDGMKALSKELGAYKRKLIVVIGILDDKDYGGMIAALIPHARLFMLTSARIGRALSPRKMEKLFKGRTTRYILSGTVPQSLKTAFKERRNGERILVTGSCYTVGEARSWLRKEKK